MEWSERGSLLLLLVLIVGGHQPQDLEGAAKSRRVHAFFYLWYGNPGMDGEWQHWNHEVLPGWDKTHPTFPQVRYLPPEDTHAPYYPMRGCYSSKNDTVLKEQLVELLGAGVGVVVISWSGRPDFAGAHDTQGIRTDQVVRYVLDAAVEVGMEVALHLEPYEDRSAETVRDDIRYIFDHYGAHAALHKGGKKKLPMLYVYDSYRIPTDQWLRLLHADGDLTIRGKNFDACVLGLWLDHHDGTRIKDGGFDGMYTYFAADGFTYGSSTVNWNSMSSFARSNGLLFVPSVGPGYDDTKIRPWNAANKRSRRGGQYYDSMWSAALAAGTQLVSITSYNEWGEGTQIESAVPKIVSSNTLSRLPSDARMALKLPEKYSDYSPYGPDYYLMRTAYWSIQLAEEDELESVQGGADDEF